MPAGGVKKKKAGGNDAKRAAERKANAKKAVKIAEDKTFGPWCFDGEANHLHCV
jgi:hypothetical protein